VSAYTPGPWTHYDDSNDGKTNRHEIQARGKTIAHIYCSVPDQDFANARLIAAAPDMYKALQEISSPAWGAKDADKVRSIARIALTKASVAREMYEVISIVANHLVRDRGNEFIGGEYADAVVAMARAVLAKVES
jgi:hypothetical protein